MVDHVNPFDNKTVTDGVTCHCQEGWGGDEGDCRINMRCVDECGFADGRGRCQEGRCYCADGYGGEGCKDRVCMNACSGHGTCTVQGRDKAPVCICADTWTGEMCDQPECPRGGRLFLIDCFDCFFCFFLGRILTDAVCTRGGFLLISFLLSLFFFLFFGQCRSWWWSPRCRWSDD